MNDMRTTVTGVVGGIIALLSQFGVGVPDWTTGLAIPVTLALLGIFSKDARKAA